MSLITRITTALQSIGADVKFVKTRQGDLTTLTTAEKTNLVGALNEVKAGSSGAPPDATEAVKGILELATLAEVATGTDTTRAVTAAGVRQERTALKNEILGGVGPMADTLQELYDLATAAEETTAINNLITTVGTKANSADVYTKTEIGDPETDLVAIYEAAKL